VINHKKAQFNLQSLGQNWLLCWKHKICFHRRKPQVHICFLLKMYCHTKHC